MSSLLLYAMYKTFVGWAESGEVLNIWVACEISFMFDQYEPQLYSLNNYWWINVIKIHSIVPEMKHTWHSHYEFILYVYRKQPSVTGYISSGNVLKVYLKPLLACKFPCWSLVRVTAIICITNFKTPIKGAMILPFVYKVSVVFGYHGMRKTKRCLAAWLCSVTFLKML
jgi:hypothetical protein